MKKDTKNKDYTQYLLIAVMVILIFSFIGLMVYFHQQNMRELQAKNNQKSQNFNQLRTSILFTHSNREFGDDVYKGLIERIGILEKSKDEKDKLISELKLIIQDNSLSKNIVAKQNNFPKLSFFASVITAACNLHRFIFNPNSFLWQIVTPLL